LEGFWIRPSFKDHFLSRRANPNITIRNFSIAVRQVLGTVIESPAGRAGARMGDELLEVDGKSVVGLSAFQAATRIQVRLSYSDATRCGS
jgi:C-terminal processing protease CtpA/Prc